MKVSEWIVLVLLTGVYIWGVFMAIREIEFNI